MVTFRSLNEVKDGDSEAKISNVSGANRKRKWNDEEDEEDEQKAEESSDSDTSSDDDHDDGGDDEQEDKKETTEVNQVKEAVCSEDKPEVVKEEQKIGKDEKNEKTADQDKVQNQKLSQPAVFIPVDRSPEIQVCVSVRVPKRCETNDATLLLAIHTAAFARYMLTCCCRRLD